jgi:hypothetical protein
MTTAELLARDKPGETRTGIVDCDIHPAIRSMATLEAYMSERWRQHSRNYGHRLREPLNGRVYPPVSPALARQDTWPANGGPPGSDLELMQKQHLDELDIEMGVLQPLIPCGRDERNPGFGAAMARAMNEWQVAEWTALEPRLKASICVPTEDAEAAVEEIDRQAKLGDFAQIFFQPRLREPLGNKRYWPIYEAAVRNDLPIGLHVGGNTGSSISGCGWPSTYGENHFDHSLAMPAAVANLVLEGVFEAFPDLKIIIVEGGFSWVPAICWRLDYYWSRLRDEVPHLKRPPSEYVRSNFWFTTQPMDEPENPGDIIDIIDWIGADRLMFATDYPHWDGDHPKFAFPGRMPQDRMEAILAGNARKVYRLN